MDPELYQRVSDLFTRACEVPPGSREQFLAESCGGDPELLLLVREFLAHDSSLPEPQDLGLQADHADLSAGDRVRDYEIQQLIGEGGMGLVYLAEQSAPVRRNVALKIIRAGMDTRALLARFERERHVLALMDHPNISKIYDAGATETGRPYFVMEYVVGAPITSYCDQIRLSLRSRLELFVRVCEAVQHAHQKGIVHRDLKPSNILVTDVDGRPVPKVIDFGIARALEDSGNDDSMRTLPGVILGTPEYMSPEQAVGHDSLDTRADVYSLGAILYELLVGCRPFERTELGDQTLDSLRRAIVQADPPRPSTRIRELGTAATTPAFSRATDRSHLEKVLRVDLDWIVMRAIEKDRARRYASASELAADVVRYLAGEPVVARPPSTGYRVAKYVRKHRYLVIGAGAVTLTLLVGMGATAWQARIARNRLARIQNVSRLLVDRFYDLADQVGGMQTKRSLAELATVTLDDINHKGHPSITEEQDLANAYEALAQVQGDPYSSSLGLVVEGRRSAYAAFLLRKKIFASDTTNVEFATRLIKSDYLVAILFQGDPAIDWRALLSSGLRLSRKLLATREIPEVMVLASICDIARQEQVWNLGQTDQAMADLAEAMKLRKRLIEIDPGNDEYQRLLADIDKTIAYVTPDRAQALDLASQALRINNRYVYKHPFSWRGLMDLAYAHRNLGYAMGRSGKNAAAIGEMKECLAVRQRMAAADTMDIRSRHFVGEAFHLVGTAFADDDQADSALVYHTQGIQTYEPMFHLSPPPFWLGYELSYSYLLTAEAFSAVGDTSNARWYYTRAIARNGEEPTDPSTYLRRLRALEEYAHFTLSIGDSVEAYRRHSMCAAVTRDMMAALMLNDASQAAVADVVASFCHIADFMAPSDPMYGIPAADLAVQVAVRRLGYANPLTIRSMATRAQVLAQLGDRAAARDQYLEALAFQPDCVIAFRPQATILRANIELISRQAGPPGSDVTVFQPRFHDRTYHPEWARRLSHLIKRNRLWGETAWPIVEPLADDSKFSVNRGGQVMR